jgi:hypothetical protein
LIVPGLGGLLTGVVGEALGAPVVPLFTLDVGEAWEVLIVLGLAELGGSAKGDRVSLPSRENTPFLFSH